MNLRQSLMHEALNKPVVDDCLCNAARVSAEQVAKQVFASAAEQGTPYRNITYQNWAKKWLASDEFVLTEIQASAVAVPLSPFNRNKVLSELRSSADSFAPIVVDLNKRGVGRTPGSGYIPPVIVVDGKHRHTANVLRGRGTVQAWVGIKALAKILKPQVELSAAALKPMRRDTNELYAGMNGTPVPRQDTGDGGSAPTMRMPAVKSTGAAMEPFTKGQKPEVVKGAGSSGGASTGGPGAGVGVGHGTGGPGGATSGANPMRKMFSDASDTKSVVDASDTDWPPDPSDRAMQNVQDVEDVSYRYSQSRKGIRKPVIVQENKSYGSGIGSRTRSTGGASQSELSKILGKCAKMDAGKIPGVIRTVAPPGFSEAAMHKLKRKFGTAGAFKVAWSQHKKQKEMEAKTAPGWEGTVKKMKDHPEIDNPYALTNWMDEEGYTPGGKGSKK